MSSIQDIRAMESQIVDIVNDYIADSYNKNDVLAISRRCGRIKLEADAESNIKMGKTTTLYPLSSLVRPGDDGKPEADIDKVSEIANQWLFLD